MHILRPNEPEPPLNDFAAYLMNFSTMTLESYGYKLDDDLIRRFSEFINDAFRKDPHMQLTTDFRSAATKSLVDFLVRLVNNANNTPASDNLITLAIFDQVHRVFCPGFYPFC